MTTLKELASAFTPDTLLNIADLPEVNVDVTIEEVEAVNMDGKSYSYKQCVVNGKRYRIANSVLEQLQTILKLKPTVSRVRVTKTGTGITTKYKVEALD